MAEPKCPNCSKEYVARVARVGFAENLLSFFYIYPFKCQLCGCRFSALQWGVRYLRMEADRREYERLPTAFSLTFRAEDFGGGGMARDVSMNGCTFRVETRQPKEGNVLSMQLRISKDIEPIAVEAVVRNVRQDLVGVEFLRFQEADKERLQLFVRDLLGRRAAEARRLENHVAGAVDDHRCGLWGESHHPVSVKLEFRI
ncbi:MAG: PilZ domain-containing protein [Deltaproteobacteria bacterium]